jgi:hypothetical protein
MRPYRPTSNVPIMGLILLAASSILLGIVIGALAYVITNFFYFLILFPLAIGIITMIAYGKLVHISKIRQSFLTLLFGVLLGFSVAAGFYGTPYLTLRQRITSGYQEKYNIDGHTASIGFDRILKDVTGSSGFLGFMKLRATSGDVYTQYLIINGLPIQSFSFSLKDTGSWVNWIVETLLFIIPSSFMGNLIGKTAFCKNANDWYNSPLTQIGSVRIEDTDKLWACLLESNLPGLCEFILPEGQIKHPQIEIYKQSTRSKKGDILLSFKLTHRVDEHRVRRQVISQWEVKPFDIESIMNMLNTKFTSLLPNPSIE